MRILVLNGSPRPKGNTKQMVDVFREGAESAGHKAYMLVTASRIYYHGVTGQLKCTLDRFYSAAYPSKPRNLKKWL